MEDFSLGAAHRREKAPSLVKPPLQRLPAAGPSPQELSDTPTDAHPRTISPRKEVERSGESETGVKRWGLPSAAVGEGLENGASDQSKGRAGAPSQQPVGLTMIANVGWEAVVPSEVLRPSPIPLGSARGEVQGVTSGASAMVAGPAQSPSSLSPPLTSDSRSPPPRSRALAKGATGAPVQRLLLRRRLSPGCYSRFGVRLLLRALGARERHGEPRAKTSGSRGSSASNCSMASPYSTGAGHSEPPRAGYPEDPRAPISSHSGAITAATVTARVARRPLRTSRSQRSRRRRIPD